MKSRYRCDRCGVRDTRHPFAACGGGKWVTHRQALWGWKVRLQAWKDRFERWEV